MGVRVNKIYNKTGFWGSLFYPLFKTDIFRQLMWFNVITAFLAIVLPMARYEMFDSLFYIKNPLAVYLIGLVFVMFLSFYFESLLSLIVVVVLNCCYLIWVITIHYNQGISHSYYELQLGYYLNLAVPVFYICLYMLSFFKKRFK